MLCCLISVNASSLIIAYWIPVIHQRLEYSKIIQFKSNSDSCVGGSEWLWSGSVWSVISHGGTFQFFFYHQKHWRLTWGTSLYQRWKWDLRKRIQYRGDNHLWYKTWWWDYQGCLKRLLLSLLSLCIPFKRFEGQNLKWSKKFQSFSYVLSRSILCY